MYPHLDDLSFQRSLYFLKELVFEGFPPTEKVSIEGAELCPLNRTLTSWNFTRLSISSQRKKVEGGSRRKYFLRLWGFCAALVSTKTSYLIL
jgi:hypothetical protein